jgi:sec-independent protein translocase protein TatA
MGFGSIWPWIIVLAIVLLLFGRGKVSGLMGDVAQGMKSFRKGLADDDDEVVQNARPIERATVEPINTTSSDERTNAG